MNVNVNTRMLASVSAHVRECLCASVCVCLWCRQQGDTWCKRRDGEKSKQEEVRASCFISGHSCYQDGHSVPSVPRLVVGGKGEWQSGMGW